jgi:DNA-binding CsgD family transcriptional regulator
VFDHEIIPRGELSATPFYTEFMRPFDVARLCMVRLGICSEGTAFLNLFRGERDRDFDARERREIEPLAGHLGRAFRMHQTLWDATMRARSAESALDAVASAIVILDHMGHVATMNTAAEQALDSGVGPRLVEGRIVGRDPAETAGLQRLIDQALGRSSPWLPARGGSLLFERGKGDLPLRVEAAPLGGHPAGGAGRAVLRFDPIRESSEGAGSFGLTRAELRVARAIAAGRRITDVAGEWGISTHTIRGQLKSVFAKTGTHRQAELVRLFIAKGDQIPG